MKALKKALTRDKGLLQTNPTQEFIANWCDTFDPEGNYSRQILEKWVKRITGIQFKYPLPEPKSY